MKQLLKKLQHFFSCIYVNTLTKRVRVLGSRHLATFVSIYIKQV